ncbi:MAG: PorT family protein [Prevotellaceae bacterium]|jgi:hypothetical protein|nr:PorT family protein [Prevotellaceae bacterium]
MKKTVLISIFTLFLCVGSVSAQLGINGGYSLASFNYTDFGGKRGMGGFMAGISYDFHIQNEWYIYTGLNYSQFRSTDKQVGAIYSKTLTYQHGLIELPVRATFVMEVIDDLKLFVAAGPKLSYAILGRKTEKNVEGETTTNIYGKKDISPFNLMAGFNMGAQYTHYRLQLGYDWGILNQYSGVENDKVAKRAGFYISLGYIF